MSGDGFAHLEEGALRAFLDECDELLQAIFRITHTVKSSAATIGHEAMTGLAHELESLLSALRSGAMPASPEVIDVLFRSLDALRVLTEEIRTGASAPLDVIDLLVRLHNLMPSARSAAAPAPAAPPIAHGLNAVRVEIAFAPSTAMPAVRALQVVMALEEIGDLLWSEPSRERIELEEVDRTLEAVVHTPDTAEQVR